MSGEHGAPTAATFRRRRLVALALAAGAAALLVVLVLRACGGPSYPDRAVSTAYCGPGEDAQDEPLRQGIVAMNDLPLGTVIEVDRSPLGDARRFTVRDRYGSGTQLDFYLEDCAAMNAWGRRTVRYRVVG